MSFAVLTSHHNNLSAKDASINLQTTPPCRTSHSNNSISANQNLQSPPHHHTHNRSLHHSSSRPHMYHSRCHHRPLIPAHHHHTQYLHKVRHSPPTIESPHSTYNRSLTHSPPLLNTMSQPIIHLPPPTRHDNRSSPQHLLLAYRPLSLPPHSLQSPLPPRTITRRRPSRHAHLDNTSTQRIAPHNTFRALR